MAQVHRGKMKHAKKLMRLSKKSNIQYHGLSWQQILTASRLELLEKRIAPLIDLKALRAFIADPISAQMFVNEEGNGVQKSLREQAITMIGLIQPIPAPTDEEVWVNIKYKFSAVGERLWEAGHVLGSREYAIGFDPFKNWGRTLRHIALNRFGYDFDDAAAYPTASLFMIEEGREICELFLKHKELILMRIGAYYFPEVTPEVKRERAKQLVHRLDMEGTLGGWLHDWNIPPYRTLQNCRIRLPDGGVFRVQQYVDWQTKRTEWLVNRRPRLVQFMKLARPKAQRLGGTVRSYMLQEFEAVSRTEKLRVAEELGHTWVSLQHDGVVIGLKNNTDSTNFAKTLTKFVSNTLGYTQKVETKPMTSEWSVSAEWIWDDNKLPLNHSVCVPDSQLSNSFMEWFEDSTKGIPNVAESFKYSTTLVFPINCLKERRIKWQNEWVSNTKIYNENKEVWEKKLWDTQLRIRRQYLNLEKVRVSHNTQERDSSIMSSSVEEEQAQSSSPVLRDGGEEGTFLSPPPRGEGLLPLVTLLSPPPCGEGLSRPLATQLARGLSPSGEGESRL